MLFKATILIVLLILPVALICLAAPWRVLVGIRLLFTGQLSMSLGLWKTDFKMDYANRLEAIVTAFFLTSLFAIITYGFWGWVIAYISNS